MEALLVGFLHILLYIIILLIVAFGLMYLLQWLGVPVPEIVKRLVMAAIAVIALILIIRLLLGGPVVLPFR